MTNSPQLEIEERDGHLRITIPFGSAAKNWMTLAATVMLFFGALMCLIAFFAVRSVTTRHGFQIVPEVMLSLIVLLYLLGLAAIRSTPGKMIEFDGASLSVGAIDGGKREIVSRNQISSLRVSRLPMVPIANLEISTKVGATIHAGVYQRRDLEAAAVKLRAVLNLNSKSGK